MWIFVFMIALLFAVVFVPGAWPAALAQPIRELFWRFLCLFGTMPAYEWLLRLRIGHLLLRNYLPSWLFRYTNVFVETSVPGVIMILLTLMTGPWQAMASATPVLYPLFIFMAALYLDFCVCVFSEAVAIVQFLLIATIFVGGAVPPAADLEMLTDPSAYLAKAALLMASGVLAGFLTVAMRRQMQDSVANAQARDHAVSIFSQQVSPEIAERLLR